MFFCRFGLGVVISIHASAREATRNVICPIYFFRFQSTPPRGRRPLMFGYNFLAILNFNPRLREGGDYHAISCVIQLSISIHASAREATPPTPFHRQYLRISIHASAREATVFMFLKLQFLEDFNPRLREGGDL